MRTLTVQSERKTQLVDITEVVSEAVAGSPAAVVTVFVPHTTAGIIVQAGGTGALAVAADVEKALESLVDASASWLHAHEGDGNPESHIRSALVASSVAVPLIDGALALGPRQRVFLAEFDGPRERSVHVAVA